jgi:hypothetical protein
VKSLGVGRWWLVVALVLTGCRTSLPGAAIAPLRASTPDEALSVLRSRVEAFGGARSLMRVRATNAGKTQSFRAQLVVASKEQMELIVYTPVGTTAATLRAQGSEITGDVPAEVMQAVKSWLSVAESAPAEMAMLVLGLPAPAGAAYEATATGLSRVAVADAVVTFDPPQFPPKRVTIRRGDDVVEIEHQEIVAGS